VLRPFRPKPGGRTDHQSDLLAGLCFQSLSGDFLMCAPMLLAEFALLLAGTEPLIRSPVPLAVHLGEHPGIPSTVVPPALTWGQLPRWVWSLQIGGLPIEVSVPVDVLDQPLTLVWSHSG
jgi:hypothetical protein